MVLPLKKGPEMDDFAPFVEAMKNLQDAPIRFAWLMDDATRFALDKARLEPGAMLFSGLITPLRDTQSTSGGVWLGGQPKFVLDMEFADQADAQQFKAALDQMVSFIGMITALGANNAEDTEKTRKMRAALTLLFLDRDGANLSKTVDIGLLQRLAAAGLPWTNVFKPDEVDEVDEAEEVEEDR
jgi:hypothetical protein